MVRSVVRRLVERGINVKAYAIFGLPTETRAEMSETVRLIADLWDTADGTPGNCRVSAFQFRPYPGTPEWTRLMATGRYTAAQLMDYRSVDLTEAGADVAMRSRDEFNFDVGIPFGEASVPEIQATLVDVTRRQHARLAG